MSLDSSAPPLACGAGSTLGFGVPPPRTMGGTPPCPGKGEGLCPGWGVRRVSSPRGRRRGKVHGSGGGGGGRRAPPGRGGGGTGRASPSLSRSSQHAGPGQGTACRVLAAGPGLHPRRRLLRHALEHLVYPVILDHHCRDRRGVRGRGAARSASAPHPGSRPTHHPGRAPDVAPTDAGEQGEGAQVGAMGTGGGGPPPLLPQLG